MTADEIATWILDTIEASKSLTNVRAASDDPDDEIAIVGGMLAQDVATCMRRLAPIMECALEDLTPETLMALVRIRGSFTIARSPALEPWWSRPQWRQIYEAVFNQTHARAQRYVQRRRGLR